MNTSKQINIMVALVFAAVLAAGAYTLWDPHRASEARDRQLEKTVDRGAYLFSQNCIVCHGDSGEGGSASNRLKLAPPLNRFDLQGKASQGGSVDAVAKTNEFKRVFYTITCGRVGRAMPTWGQSQGGPLNDEQIKQLATLITEGIGWDISKDYAINGAEKFDVHGYGSDNIRLTADIGDSTTAIPLSDVSLLSKGLRLEPEDAIENPNTPPAYELMLITDVDKTAKTVTVQRALGTTAAVPHKAGIRVLKPPVPPEPPAITGETGTPSCGQVLQAAGPTPTPAPPSTQLTISAKGTAFNTAELTGVANQPLTITFDNQETDGTLHNIKFFNGKNEKAPELGATDIAAEGQYTLALAPLAAGQYYYHCDVHPQMNGFLLTVEGGGAAPAAATTPAAAETAAPTPAASGGAAATATP